jgi:HD superfamily phosphohydrolase YqeK
MQMRAMVFRALSHHLEEHCRAVYEFCHDWVSQGNQNTNNIEFYFQNYLKETHDEKIYKLEKCLDLDYSKYYAPEWD